MYQDGYGTKRDTKKALEMYRKAVEFGSSDALRNLRTVHTQNSNNERRTLTNPSYE
jgi:TPR repeat protein